MRQGSATTAESVDRYRAAVDAIAHSAGFRRSPRLRDMLVHIANATLSGNLDELTESRIAAKVFERPEYNPAEDNLVRVSARQLRNKIAEYYEGDGRFDDVVLEVPKGGYLGVFHMRHGLPADTPPAARELTTGGRPRPKARGVLVYALAASTAVLMLIAGLLWNQNRQLRNAVAPSDSPVLFDVLVPSSGQRTNIVITDSALVLFEHMMHQYIPLEDYVSGRYLEQASHATGDRGKDDLVAMLRTRQITSLADLHIISNILQRYSRSGVALPIQHARNMRIREFDTGDNFIVIGSARSNPWASLFEKTLAFHLQNRYGSSCFENAHTPSGQPRLYCLQDSANEEGTDYAHVALLHTGNGRGRVLLIAGADMESTEAAGNFVLNPQSVQPVLSALRVRRVADLPDFELLLKAYSLGGSGRSPELVYARAVGSVH